MSIRFDTALLIKDVDATRKRRKISMLRAANRMGLHAATIYNMRSGKNQEITVSTLARIIDFLGNSDISKYIYDDGE